MSPQDYRFYCHDSFGRLHNAEWFDAANDEEAIALISQNHPDSTCEIWQGKRLVATLSPRRLQA